jgi:hypothetical protein
MNKPGGVWVSTILLAYSTIFKFGVKMKYPILIIKKIISIVPRYFKLMAILVCFSSTNKVITREIELKLKKRWAVIMSGIIISALFRIKW